VPVDRDTLDSHEEAEEACSAAVAEGTCRMDTAAHAVAEDRADKDLYRAVHSCRKEARALHSPVAFPCTEAAEDT
jgi:hypothetical protein